MNIPPKSVVVSHPGKQHSYQVALALECADLLRQFITGVYFKPDEFPYTLARRLPMAIRQRALGVLNRRRLAELDDRLVTSVPYHEIVSRTVGKLPPLLRITERQSGYLFSNWAGDLFTSNWLQRCVPRPAMLYSFLGSALHSFQHARQLGVCTVLDVPITLNAFQIVAEEKQSLGIPSRCSKLAPRLQAEVLSADYVLVPSDIVAKSTVALGLSPARVITIPFGVDVARFRPRSPSQAHANHKFRVLFVGRFDIRKGIHHLLEAWRELALPESELVIVGPSGDPKFVREMRARYRGLFTEVGYVPHSQLSELYAQADVYVFPSLAEGSAYVTYEALASGLPCIVTSEAGSVVRDGIEGFVVPRGDIPSLKEHILRLYHDGALRRQMSVAARERAQEYSWQHYHVRLVNALERIAEDRHVD